MNVDILIVGPLRTNCYLVHKDKKCLIIDPGSNENFIIKAIREKELEPIAILITHHHQDHDECSDSIKSIYNIPIYDMNNLFEGNSSLGEFIFEVIYTPGHTEDSICFYFKKYNIMFTGDFLFKGSVGRTDLETGSYEDMIRSIEKIKTYPDDTIIYPGHGEITNLGIEKQENKYF